MTILDFGILGFIGGLSPGPITALMLGETFRNGCRRGMQVPLAVIFSNIIIAPLAVLILYLGSNIDIIITIVTYAGGAILLFLGVKEWQAAGKLEFKTAHNPFKRALLIDLLNAHPYIFWFTVLGPQIVFLLREKEFVQTLIYWFVFVGTLVGLKVLLALIAHNIKPFLDHKSMIFINKFLAVTLLLFGLKVLLNL